MKKTSLLMLICFSFFYTDKVIDYINMNSSLMKQIENIKDEYNTMEVNGYIEDDTIIPGISGKRINVNKSFSNMKEYNTFVEEFLVYDNILPSIKLKDNRDKYIIKGNGNKKMVSLLLIVDSNNINRFFGVKGITLFVNHDIINIENINKLKSNELYSYGNNGIYSRSLLINDNSLINNLSNNRSKYCLVKEKNDDVIDVCKSNDMYTIIPNIRGNYMDVKERLTGGSIVLLDSVNNLDNIIQYIKNKGYEIVYLYELLEE